MPEYDATTANQLEQGNESQLGFLYDGSSYTLSAGLPPSGPILFYKMRAQDDGVAPPGYVTWTASPDPDFAGAGFAGGTPTPVGSMIAGSATVVAKWEE